MRHNKKDRYEGDCEDQEKIGDSAQIVWEKDGFNNRPFFLNPITAVVRAKPQRTQSKNRQLNKPLHSLDGFVLCPYKYLNFFATFASLRETVVLSFMDRL